MVLYFRALLIGLACAALNPSQPRSVLASVLLVLAVLLHDVTGRHR